MADTPGAVKRIAAISNSPKSLLAAEELISVIQSGAYAVGDRLPSERTLASQMGVSRSVVREAISALHIVGVVASAVGDGTYVQSHLTQADIDAALRLLEVDGDLEDWLEARELVETQVACLAATRATEADLVDLEGAVAHMKAAIDAFDVDRYLIVDLTFHQALVKAGHNATLGRMTSILLASMERQLWKNLKRSYFSQQRLLANSFDRHRRIVSALRERNVEAVRASVSAHFTFLNEGLED